MNHIWWKTGVVYHIYPRSFQDSDHDGVGDLNGVRRRLGYLAWLGVDAIWLSPFYKSPMKDFGYDVSDYCSVDPLFRSMACFDALVTEAHAHGLKRKKETVRVSPGPSATLVHSFNSNIGRATLATTS